MKDLLLHLSDVVKLTFCSSYSSSKNPSRNGCCHHIFTSDYTNKPAPPPRTAGRRVGVSAVHLFPLLIDDTFKFKSSCCIVKDADPETCAVPLSG